MGVIEIFCFAVQTRYHGGFVMVLEMERIQGRAKFEFFKLLEFGGIFWNCG